MTLAAIASGALSFLGSQQGQQLVRTGLQAFSPRPGIPVGATGFQPGMGFAAPAAGFPPLLGATSGGFGRQKVGRFSGQAIPRGTKEKISKSGAIILTEVHRAKGLSGRDLRGFNRTIGLLRRVGMVPKRLGRTGARGYRRKKAA